MLGWRRGVVVSGSQSGVAGGLSKSDDVEGKSKVCHTPNRRLDKVIFSVRVL